MQKSVCTKECVIIVILNLLAKLVKVKRKVVKISILKVIFQTGFPKKISTTTGWTKLILPAKIILMPLFTIITIIIIINIIILCSRH